MTTEITDNCLYTSSLPPISVIVPLLNELQALPLLFETLAAQRDVDLELLLCDGGSSDGSQEEARRLAATVPFPVRLLESTPGRGAQMNAGRRAATSPFLLFLHADCRFAEEDALARGVALLQQEMEKEGHNRLAARFGLQFFHIPDGCEEIFHFHAAKARQNRPDCIHGDQGWLMPAGFFDAVGPFDESLPFFEDARLAPKIVAAGRWLLLDRAILTSARRFGSEGVSDRRWLNALIMVWGRSGCDALLERLPGIYRQQQQAEQLELAPFIAAYRAYIATLLPAEYRRHRTQLGKYLAANLWQLLLVADCRREFRKGLPPGSAPRLLPLLEPLLTGLQKLPPLRWLLLAIWDRLLARQQ